MPQRIQPTTFRIPIFSRWIGVSCHMSGPGAYVPAAFSAWSTIASNDSPSKQITIDRRTTKKPWSVHFWVRSDSVFFLMAPFVTYGFVCNAWICSYTTTYKKNCFVYLLLKRTGVDLWVCMGLLSHQPNLWCHSSYFTHLKQSPCDDRPFVHGVFFQPNTKCHHWSLSDPWHVCNILYNDVFQKSGECFNEWVA